MGIQWKWWVLWAARHEKNRRKRKKNGVMVKQVFNDASEQKIETHLIKCRNKFNSSFKIRRNYGIQQFRITSKLKQVFLRRFVSYITPYFKWVPDIATTFIALQKIIQFVEMFFFFFIFDEFYIIWNSNYEYIWRLNKTLKLNESVNFFRFFFQAWSKSMHHRPNKFCTIIFFSCFSRADIFFFHCAERCRVL